MRVNGYGKANGDDIIAYEQKTGCKLPEDYRDFLLEFNGGEPEVEENYVYIPSIKSFKFKICVFRWVSKTQEVNDYDEKLIKAVDNLGMYIDPKTVIPFVRAYGSIPIVMITQKGMEGIYVFDFQIALKESSKKKYLHKICDTFTEFLDLIVPDEE